MAPKIIVDYSPKKNSAVVSCGLHIIRNDKISIRSKKYIVVCHEEKCDLKEKFAIPELTDYHDLKTILNKSA